MHDRLFEVALGITPPWFVTGVQFDAPSKVLSVGIDFIVGSRFDVEGAAGEHDNQLAVFVVKCNDAFYHCQFQTSAAVNPAAHGGDMFRLQTIVERSGLPWLSHKRATASVAIHHGRCGTGETYRVAKPVCMSTS